MEIIDELKWKLMDEFEVFTECRRLAKRGKTRREEAKCMIGNYPPLVLFANAPRRLN